MIEADIVQRATLGREPDAIGLTQPSPFARSDKPLRILHVCEVLPGGLSSYLHEILPYQAARYGQENITLVAPEDQVEFVRGAGAISFVGYSRTGRNLSSVSSLAIALRQEIEAREPDILHLHSSIAGAVGRLVAAGTEFRGRLVYCAHGWATDPGRRSRMRRLIQVVERVLYDASDAIVNISPHEEGFLPAAWRRSGKVRLIQSGIAPAPPPRERLAPVPDDAPWRLLFVGRTERQKGFDLLMGEMPMLLGQARLTVVGGGAADDALQPFDPPNVRRLGWLPREQIAEQIDQADFVVMPSRWEGMPLVALEAFRAGRPVIGANYGAFPYIIEHGRTGLLVDIQAPGFLARALAEVTRSQAYEMAARAREAFELRFTSTEMNRQLIELYEELCSAPASRAQAPPVMATARLARAA